MARPAAHPTPPDDGPRRRLATASGIAALIVILVAGLVLLGWQMGNETLLRIAPRAGATMPNMAVGLLLCGAGLWLLHDPAAGARRRGLGSAIAALAAVLGVFVVAEHTVGVHPAFDRVLFPGTIQRVEPVVAGLPTLASGVSLICIGSALLLLDSRWYSGLRPAQLLVLVPGFLALEALVGYGYGRETLLAADIGAFAPMPIPTAVSFILLAFGTLVARPEGGFVELFTGDDSAALMARWLLPAALFVPLLLGWLRILGQRAGLYSSTTGTALFVVAIMLAFTLLIGWNAAVVRRLNIARTRAEAALRESEERFRSIFERSGIGIAIADSRGRLLLTNPAVQRLLGYSADELAGMSVRRLTYPEDFDVERDLFADLIAGRREFYQVEKRYVRKDGSIMWGRLTGTLLRDTATGRAIGMLEDITERRELEQERARLTAVVNATTDFVGTARVDGRIMTLNAAARRMLGIGEAEVVEGLEVKDMHPPREYARIRNEGIPVAIRDGAWSGETVIAARDGREIPASQVILAHRGPDGDVEFLSTIMRDIRGRIRRERNERLLLDASGVLTHSLDENAVLRSLAELLARDRADYCLIDRIDPDGATHPTIAVHRRPEAQARLDELIARVPPPDAQPGVREVLRTGSPVGIEHASDAWLESATLDATHRELLRRLSLHSHIIVPLRAHDLVIGALTVARTTTAEPFTPHDLVVMEDLAGRTAVAIENCRLYHETQRAIQTRDEVLRVVAHDLRNPLSTIGLAAGIVVDTLPASMTAELRQLEIVTRSVKLANRLIQDLLDVARMQAGRLSVHAVPVDTVDLVTEAVELHRGLAADRAIDLVGEVPRDLPDVCADRDRILQVFANLIGNAIKFTPEGGRISVRAEPIDDAVRFLVSDTGPGIAEADREHLFDPFWQGRPGGVGAGLGLPLARGIVEAHGGSLDLASEPGAGTTLDFRIPTARVHAPAHPQSDRYDVHHH